MILAEKYIKIFRPGFPVIFNAKYKPTPGKILFQGGLFFNRAFKALIRDGLDHQLLMLLNPYIFNLFIICEVVSAAFFDDVIPGIYFKYAVSIRM